MPPIRLRRPRRGHTPGVTLEVRDQCLLPSLERWERQHVVERATLRDNQRGRLEVLMNFLDTNHPQERDLTLQRLERNPNLRDAVHTFWDACDAEIVLAEQARALEDLARTTRQRAQLEYHHMENQMRRMLLLGVDDVLANVSPGMGTQEDPVDADVFETASEASEEPPPAPRPRRRAFGSSGSEVDDEGHLYHRDGRRCRSMWAHGADYETDSGLEREIHSAEGYMILREELREDRRVRREAVGDDSD